MTQTHRPHEKPRIGISIGDINGIGPEVILKALADHRILGMLTPIIYGSGRVLSFYRKLINLEEINYAQVKNRGHFLPKQINVVTCWEDTLEITPGKPSPETGKNAVTALQQACTDLKEGLIDALVTAPVDKNTIHSDAFPFTGHTAFLSHFFNSPKSLMLMVSENLRVGLVTEHVPVQAIALGITKEAVESKLNVLESSLKIDFGIPKPKMAVLALNPHAGDGGLIGDEEVRILRPIITEQKSKGKIINGPFPADGFFATGQYQKYDGILAMYHDQGLIPFKSMAFESGINFTAGLSVVRTSPDHGTAYNIAGKNLAEEGSMREAIYRAADLFKRRSEAI